MAACAWVLADPEGSNEQPADETPTLIPDLEDPPPGLAQECAASDCGGGGDAALGNCYLNSNEAECGRLELETLALVAFWRAARSMWALALCVLRPEAGDVAAAVVAAISLCSVAFLAWPTFRALEDAEQTYQVTGA